MDSISFSQSVSKEFGNEKTSISELYFEDLDRRIDAITTEVIEKGNTILDTYEVLSDAISGGMGRSYGRERFDSKTTSVDNLNNYALSKEGRYVQARDHDRYFRQESTHLWQTLLRLCFFDRVLCLADHLFGRADPQYSPGGEYQLRHQ